MAQPWQQQDGKGNAPVLQVSFQLTALHGLLALSLERTQHNQLVQQVPHQEAGLVALQEGELLAIHGTEVVLLHEVLQALETVRVPTGRVHGLQQGLQADVADELIVHLVLEVVQVIVQQGVGLATLTAQLGHLGHRLLRDGVSHGSQHQEGDCHTAALPQTSGERERERFPANCLLEIQPVKNETAFLP